MEIRLWCFFCSFKQCCDAVGTTITTSV